MKKTSNKKQFSFESRKEALLELILKAESIHRVDLDRAHKLYQDAVRQAEILQDKALLARALQRRGDTFRFKNEFELANADFKAAIDLARGLDLRVEMMANCGMGIIARLEKRWDDAREKQLEAIKIARERGDISSEAVYYSNIALIYEAQGDLDGSAASHSTAVRLASQLKANKFPYTYVLNQLASFSLNIGDPMTAKAYLDEISPAIIASGNISEECFLYRNLASTCILTNEYKDGLHWANKAVESARNLASDMDLFFALLYRGNIEFELDSYSSALKDFEEASKYIKEKNWQCTIFSEMSRVYSIIGNTALAERTLSQCEELLPFVPENYKPELLKTLSQTKRILGDQEGSYKALLQSGEIKDKVFSSKIRNEIGSLRLLMKIEREEHEKELFKLRTENLERELSIKATSFASQTELLSAFREDLRRIIRKIEVRDPAINELIAKLKELPDGVNWKEFEEQFRQVHPEFKANLQKKFPELSEDELQVCALFRLKLKSPDIGKLLSLSYRTVQNRRNRIRKKLGLIGGDDIAKYLGGF